MANLTIQYIYLSLLQHIISDETTRLFNTDIPKITIPVRPGRSIASLIEVAAMNHRLKVMGYNAAEAFTNQLNQFIQSKSNH